MSEDSLTSAGATNLDSQDSLSNQPSSNRFRRWSRSLSRLLILIALLVGVGYLILTGWRLLRPVAKVDGTTLTYEVKPRDLIVMVSESGGLESQKTVDGVCELNRYENKIIFIVDEGTSVKKDDVVVRFDPSEVDEDIAEQKIRRNEALAEVEANEQEIEVTRNTNESEIAQAEMELKLADLDLKKYEKGDYLVSQNELKGKIALAESEFQQAKDAYMHLKELVKAGFREPEQLQSGRQAVESAQFNLRRDKESLRVLEDFEHERSLTEFSGKAKEAARALERAKTSAVAKMRKAEGAYEASKDKLALEEKELKDDLAQKEKCEIKAPQSGIVAYAQSRRYGGRPIGPGVTVYQQQTIFHLPDLSRLKVKVQVHESLIKKVKLGQKAKIRVTAFPSLLLDGTVSKVSLLADSSRSWLQNGVKEYTCFVDVDELPDDQQLKPGMSAEVEVLVGEYKDVLAVPVQAVTEQKGRHYAFVKTGGRFVSQKVRLGKNNNKFVEVVSGLSTGDVIALDARERAREALVDNEDAFAVDGLEEDAEPVESAKNEAEIGENETLSTKDDSLSPALPEGRSQSDGERGDVTSPQGGETEVDAKADPESSSEDSVTNEPGIETATVANEAAETSPNDTTQSTLESASIDVIAVPAGE